MSTYNDDQMNKIMQMPTAVFMDAMLAESGSMIVSMREFMTGEKFISKAGNMYPGNSLIQALVKNPDLPKMEKAIQHVFAKGDKDKMRAECQVKIKEGLSVLGNDNEAIQFKSFLTAIAEEVVNATGKGFFGNRGPKETSTEAAYLNSLKQQMDTSSPPPM